MHHAGVTLVRGDPTLKNNAPESSSGRTARANFTLSPEKAVRASLSVSSVVSIVFVFVFAFVFVFVFVQDDFFTCSPEKAVRASLSVSLVVSLRVPFCK